MMKDYHVKIVLHLLHEEDIAAENQEDANRIAVQIYRDVSLDDCDQEALELENVIEVKEKR